MSKTGAALLLLPALAALGWCARQAVEARRLREELRELRGRLERRESRPAPRPPEAAAVEELRAELARVEAKVAAAPAAAPPAVTAEELRTLVDERIEARSADPEKAKPAGGVDDRKMPLHDMAKELVLDPETQRRVGEIANEAKREIFDVLKTPRPDGTEMAADLMTAFLSGDGQKTAAVFQRLFTEKVPGGERTYLMVVAGVQDRARERLKGTMGEAVYTRFAHMNVRPENIETGWDPWADYVKEKGLTAPR